MSTAIDQTHDVNLQGLHMLDVAYGLPAFVKNASHDQVCGNDQLEPHMFADVTRRRYPCHTAPATWVSAGFFFQKRAEYPSAAAALIEKRIKESATHYGILSQVTELQQKVANAAIVDESQLPDNTFALVMQFDDGTVERKYPMRNALEVKVAANYLQQHREQLTYRDRQCVANKILEKAAEFGADLGDHMELLERTVGTGTCAAKTAAELVRSRIPYIKLENDKLAAEFEKLADQIAARKVNAVWHSYDKLADVIDGVDRDFHLTGLYTSRLEYPEDVLFAITTKVATDKANDLVGTLTGNYYKKADLERVPLSLLSDALGEDFASEVSTANAWVDVDKLANIAPTLPLGDAELFDAAIMESGVRPFATKQASEARKVLRTDVENMAACHTSPSPGGLWAHIRR